MESATSTKDDDDDKCSGGAIEACNTNCWWGSESTGPVLGLPHGWGAKVVGKCRQVVPGVVVTNAVPVVVVVAAQSSAEFKSQIRRAELLIVLIAEWNVLQSRFSNRSPCLCCN